MFTTSEEEIIKRIKECTTMYEHTNDMQIYLLEETENEILEMHELYKTGAIELVIMKRISQSTIKEACAIPLKRTPKLQNAIRSCVSREYPSIKYLL